MPHEGPVAYSPLFIDKMLRLGSITRKEYTALKALLASEAAINAEVALALRTRVGEAEEVEKTLDLPLRGLKAFLRGVALMSLETPVKPSPQSEELQDELDYLRGTDENYLQFIEEGMTHQEAQLVAILKARKGHAIPYDSIIDKLWSNGRDVPLEPQKTLKVVVCKLRKRHPEVKIRTIWGRGLMWEGD